MIQQYIEFIYPGLLFSETSEQPVDRREVPERLPENCFGFRFKERQEQTSAQGEKLLGKFTNLSHWYYKKGEVYTLAQVKDQHRHRLTLIENMVNNKISRVLLTKFGQWIPLADADVVLDRT
jgi:hypothetical protein